MSGPKSDAIVAEKKLITEPMKKITKPKVKKEKDPGAPERPPTAFVLFMETNFPDYTSNAVVAKEGGATWNAMSESEKAPYVEKAAAKKAEYGIALKLHNVELAEAKEKSESTSKSSLEVHDYVEDVASSQNNLFVSEVCSRTKEHKLADFFSGARVILDYDSKLKYVRSATILFRDASSRQKGLLLSGKLLDNRPVIISVTDAKGEKLPLYLKVENLAPQAKKEEVKKQFQGVTKTPVRVYVPMKKEGNVNWGCAFVYVCSVEAYRACLGVDNELKVCNKKVRVVAGLYKGGRNRKREP